MLRDLPDYFNFVVNNNKYLSIYHNVSKRILFITFSFFLLTSLFILLFLLFGPKCRINFQAFYLCSATVHREKAAHELINSSVFICNGIGSTTFFNLINPGVSDQRLIPGGAQKLAKF